MQWKKNMGKTRNFIKSTKTNSPTGHSGATILPPVGDSSIYIETSAGNYGNGVFCSFERTDIFGLVRSISIITGFQF